MANQLRETLEEKDLKSSIENVAVVKLNIAAFFAPEIIWAQLTPCAPG